MLIKSRNALASSMGRPVTGAVQVSCINTSPILVSSESFYQNGVTSIWSACIYLASFMMHYMQLLIHFINSGWGSSTHDSSQRSRVQLLNSWWVWCAQRKAVIYLMTVVLEKNGSQILHCCINCILFSGPAFDPLGQARGPAPPLEEKNEDAWVVFLFKYLQYAHVLHKKLFPLISLGKPPPKLQNCTKFLTE